MKQTLYPGRWQSDPTAGRRGGPRERHGNAETFSYEAVMEQRMRTVLECALSQGGELGESPTPLEGGGGSLLFISIIGGGGQGASTGNAGQQKCMFRAVSAHTSTRSVPYHRSADQHGFGTQQRLALVSPLGGGAERPLKADWHYEDIILRNGTCRMGVSAVMKPDTGRH